MKSHLRDVFQNRRVMGGRGGSWSPAKRGVASDEHCRNGHWIMLGERAANCLASFQFVVIFNF